jgi:hypothetical protein
MNTARGTDLVKGFIGSLNGWAGAKVIRTSISQNVLEYTGDSNLFLYVKGRAEQPLRWGVTANVIQRLQSQAKPCAVILLFEFHDHGYFLTQNDVESYIRNIWPLAKDGDYKISSGSYLSGKQPFYSMQGFRDAIVNVGCSG